MFANGLISKNVSRFLHQFVSVLENSLSFILKAELICKFLYQGIFLITKGDFRVFILGGQCGCTKFNEHNLFYSRDRHLFIDVVASPKWPSEWLMRQMHPRHSIWYPKPNLQLPNLFSLGVERVNATPNPGQWTKGKVSWPRQ